MLVEGSAGGEPAWDNLGVVAVHSLDQQASPMTQPHSPVR